MFKKYSVLLGIFLLFSHVSFAKEPMKWVFTNYPPANYTTDAGELKGFLYDIASEALERRMGIPLDVSIYPWKRCQLLVKEGKADMIVTIPTEERLTYAIPTEKPLWIKTRILYTYPDHPRMAEIHKLNGLQDIQQAGFSVVSYMGNGWVETVVEGADIPVQYANTVEGMYKMLSQKRGDLIIEEASLVFPKLQELGLTEQIVATNGVGEESGFHILIGNASPYADKLPQLNATIEEMWNDGTIENILSKYGM